MVAPRIWKDWAEAEVENPPIMYTAYGSIHVPGRGLQNIVMFQARNPEVLAFAVERFVFNSQVNMLCQALPPVPAKIQALNKFAVLMGWGNIEAILN